MKLMILDGNSIVNRAFFGVRPLTAPDGTPTNALYGFLAILQRMLEEQKPEAVCVSFDLKAPTFRHRAYEGYKSKRAGMPEDLAVQMPLLKELLDAMGIRRYELEGYEADDILGTAARICEEKGWNCVIVTGDKDSLQLVSESTSVCNVKTRMGQTETILYTPQVFREEYGFDPPKMVDLKALMGDSSDNIPGVPGIGEKTALDLLHRYGSLDGIYRDLDALDVKPGVLKKLREGEESARLSYWLATILREVPLPFDPAENRWDKDYTSALYPMMQRLGFLKFIERWGLAPTEETVAERESEHTLLGRIQAGFQQHQLEVSASSGWIPVGADDNFASILQRSFGIMNCTIARMAIEQTPPDILVNLPYDSYHGVYGYSHAHEIATLGRQLMAKALDEYESR